MIGRLLENLRDGRTQRLLAATTALSAPALGLEIYFEHLKGSFGDKWMWTPLVLTPPLTAAGIAGVASERAAKTSPTAMTAETVVNYTNGSIVAGGVTLDPSKVVASSNREEDQKETLKSAKARPAGDNWSKTQPADEKKSQAAIK